MNLNFNIEVKDQDNEFYRDKNGNKVINSFSFDLELSSDELVKRICTGQYNAYNAITGSENINIEVRAFNAYTRTCPIIYSYYGKENRFVKL